ncbi:MAG: hypothetical protein WAU39_15050 [Polyangiales bacterium]
MKHRSTDSFFRQGDGDAYAPKVGSLEHRITVRLSDAHLDRLDRVAGASGFTPEPRA